ncbi:zinc finger protein 182 [Fopius arisanus]|uniref:Lola_21 protein n=1 Tax=Fopius arisanus TaxID=64838 RepID=A0A0C9R621_9HYME|nr:PREDICTED: zinc finger protein 182 [Fopius arisanus]
MWQQGEEIPVSRMQEEIQIPIRLAQSLGHPQFLLILTKNLLKKKKTINRTKTHIASFNQLPDFPGDVITVNEYARSSVSPIDWYYHYQSMYLRLVAENQITEANIGLTDYGYEDRQHGQVNPKESPSDNSGNYSAQPSGYFCPKCGNAYSRPHSLNRHIRFECGVEPQFECPICHKKSKHKHNLVLHMRTHQKSQ